MESGPAIFVGTVFALFGGGLLVWTAVRVRQGEPVAVGVNRVASATLMRRRRSWCAGARDVVFYARVRGGSPVTERSRSG